MKAVGSGFTPNMQAVGSMSVNNAKEGGAVNLVGYIASCKISLILSSCCIGELLFGTAVSWIM